MTELVYSLQTERANKESAKWLFLDFDTYNLFDIPDGLPQKEEFVEIIARGDDFRLERLISHGHTTPSGEWYDQDQNEWVVLLQGEAMLEWRDGTAIELKPGDAILIEAHCQHRVAYTTEEPPCVWLAIHGSMQLVDSDG